jgi:hypothetical protein
MQISFPGIGSKLPKKQAAGGVVRKFPDSGAKPAQATTYVAVGAHFLNMVAQAIHHPARNETSAGADAACQLHAVRGGTHAHAAGAGAPASGR